MRKIFKYIIKIVLVAFGVLCLFGAMITAFLGYFLIAGVFGIIGIVCIYVGWAYGKSGKRIIELHKSAIDDMKKEHIIRQEKEREREKEKKRREEERKKREDELERIKEEARAKEEGIQEARRGY
jgi:amino acid permease